jgi:hypothetical protein
MVAATKSPISGFDLIIIVQSITLVAINGFSNLCNSLKAVYDNASIP